MNKSHLNKAQLFSMMAIFMSALFIIMFSGLTHVALNKDVEIIETEIARFGTLAESLDYFVHKSLDTSGFIILHNSAQKLYEDCGGSPTPACYFSNFTQTFYDCLDVGESSDGWDCMGDIDPPNHNASYKAQLEFLADELENRYADLQINISDTKVGVRQSGPYTFELTAEVELAMIRPGYSWDRFFNVTREVNVMGMNDPALSAFRINKSILVHPTEGELMTVASLSGNYYRIAQVVNDSYYIRDNRSGISITEMFEGVRLVTPNNDTHPFGITCVLPLDLVEDGSGVLQNRDNRSLLEHQFLGDFLFTGGNTLFRFDDENFYGVDDDIIVDSGFFARLSILNFKYVGNCCRDSQYYGVDGACDNSCG
ncbi:hypothetical protein JXA48_02290 [Candidatus Woesearchaeota archaeon]|nr:hypothetical protein [Candidatus Woesearchaeota archaeon]